ncbi:MAG: hypothetical protein ABFC62_06490 [Clostridiaceae bacterium]|nr:hypothetical protein [Eubacteriales bacterium]
MNISSNILKECLKNVYFINGTAYAGKSTMVRMLARKHNMIECGENYHHELASKAATVEAQPNLSYFKTMSGWQEFINRTPESYARWIEGTSQEAAEFEVAELIRLSASGKRIIADTNISVESLKEISDYRRVAILLSPQSMSANRFFERDDADKQFILRQIRAAENPEKTLENYNACIAKINSAEVFGHFKNSGFFTLYRENAEKDTREEVLAALERHFGLV